ncbi:MAG: hypothetical protein IH991_22190 [Planctomycetes bacterium]|nr:hypothetical protein [Planctomycetota bacterium]
MMNDELDHKQPSPDNNAPVTKRDLDQLMQRLDMKFDELKRHFDVTVENIEDEMKLANREEIELIMDKQRRHEVRISALETR